MKYELAVDQLLKRVHPEQGLPQARQNRTLLTHIVVYFIYFHNRQQLKETMLKLTTLTAPSTIAQRSIFRLGAKSLILFELKEIRLTVQYKQVFCNVCKYSAGC